MKARSEQVAEGAWVQFMYEYPGPVAASAKGAWEAALTVTTPEVLLVHARAYRLLVEQQDEMGMGATQWLTMMHSALTEPEPDGPSDLECFAAAARAIRGGLLLSQVDLAAKAGINAATVSRIEAQPEACKVRRSTLLALADALGWTVDEMVELGHEVLTRG